MPRIISDELFYSLMKCVKDQRLLGVMGKLEQLERDAISVDFCYGVFVPLDARVVIIEPEVLEDGPTTNNN